MSTTSPPTVLWHGDQDAPLVVLLHGRGSDAADIIGLADHLPPHLGYAAVRAPLAEGPGFAWFANRGIGRPIAESLAETMAWFREWLDQAVDVDRPVVLVGFSGGAAFAGGLVLSDPTRFAGAAILHGTLPFEAGVLTDQDRLNGVRMFVGQGALDMVIPSELQQRTWDYLTETSGANTVARRYESGHQLIATEVSDVGEWLQAITQSNGIRTRGG
jgi:phospholipase/carboxylesterase